ncbi:MAG: hypothetical protein H0X50_06010 [Nitrosopumilus sp.]|nr:hypothetical protein [Nitrosopumilus sp.]
MNNNIVTKVIRNNSPFISKESTIFTSTINNLSFGLYYLNIQITSKLSPDLDIADESANIC